VHVAQVEALRPRVQFQKAPALAGDLDHALEVKLVGLGLVHNPAGGMGEDREIRALESSEHSIRLPALGQVRALMDRTRGQVEATQQPFGQVKRAVLEDLDLRRLQQERVAPKLVVETFDLVELLAQTLPAKAVGTCGPVGDGDWS